MRSLLPRQLSGLQRSPHFLSPFRSPAPMPPDITRALSTPRDPTDMTGPRVTGLIEQAKGVDQGIADARQANTITPAEAQRLHMRAAHISQAAEQERLPRTMAGYRLRSIMICCANSTMSTRRSGSIPAPAS